MFVRLSGALLVLAPFAVHGPVARHRIVEVGRARRQRNNKSSNNSIHSSGYKSSYHCTKRLNLTLSGLPRKRRKLQ